MKSVSPLLFNQFSSNTEWETCSWMTEVLASAYSLPSGLLSLTSNCLSLVLISKLTTFRRTTIMYKHNQIFNEIFSGKDYNLSSLVNMCPKLRYVPQGTGYISLRYCWNIYQVKWWLHMSLHLKGYKADHNYTAAHLCDNETEITFKSLVSIQNAITYTIEKRCIITIIFICQREIKRRLNK